MQVRTLTDGGQTASDVAASVATFLRGANTSLDVALYDLALSPAVAAPIVGAFRDAVSRGVAVRLVYNVDHDAPLPDPRPSRTPPELVDSLGVPARPIPGIPDLMHHKYVVRDGASLLTGSTNWTDDSWSREENVSLVAHSVQLAQAFARDFVEMWTTGLVADTGAFDMEPATVDGASVRAWFSPGRGRKLAHRIATAIGRAERRVRVASPVITAGPILGTLCEVAAEGRVDLAGVCDGTQMREVLHQWHDEPAAAWKIPAFRSLVSKAPFAGKRSAPYGPATVHDSMHAKVTVADDIVFVGSYNLSSSGQANAENMLEIRDPRLADRLAGFIDQVRARYPSAPGV